MIPFLYSDQRYSGLEMLKIFGTTIVNSQIHGMCSVYSNMKTDDQKLGYVIGFSLFHVRWTFNA